MVLSTFFLITKRIIDAKFYRREAEWYVAYHFGALMKVNTKKPSATYPQRLPLSTPRRACYPEKQQTDIDASNYKWKLAEEMHG